jgi:two-component system, response regulator
MATQHKPVIIYVEDNSGDALLLREALIQGRHEVELLIIESGDKALHYFQVKCHARDVPPPHCILLDAHLPMVTGIELVKFIRRCSTFDQTPVFLFAAPKDCADVQEAVDISPDSFLKKPTEWDHFILLAETLMRGAQQNGHAPVDEPEKDAAPPAELRQIP